MRDIKDIKLPATTKEFAQWLRDIAVQIERIPDQPLLLSENDVEVGFYYGNPAFPQKPTGLHFQVDSASTMVIPKAPRHQSVDAKVQAVCRFCGCSIGFGHTMCGPCSDVP